MARKLTKFQQWQRAGRPVVPSAALRCGPVATKVALKTVAPSAAPGKRPTLLDRILRRKAS